MDIREKLVELLHKGVRCPGVIANCLDCQYFGIDEPCDSFGATVDMLLANGVTVQEWIPVSERLPTQKDGKILGGYLLAIQNGKKPNVWKWTEVAKHPEYFTYWYSLPTPPKGE